MEVVSATELPSPETVDITFHGVVYALTVAVSGSDTLVVEIEQKDDMARWRGEFSAKYVEDITSKTGNFKRFPVFVRMLASAARQQSDSVFIDLLTYSDLEMLKARKAAAPGQQQQQQQQQQQARQSAANSKRYLILTYCAEFDRVHYPLPLLHEESPDPARLMATIQQLRRQLQQQQGQQQGQQSRSSNGGLDARSRDGGPASTSGADGGGGAGGGGIDQRVKVLTKERDLLRARLEAAEAELERERGLHRRELRRRAKEGQEAQQELQRLRQQVQELQARCKQLSAAAELEGSRRARAAEPQRRQTTDNSSRWSHGSGAAYLAGGPRSKYPVRSGSAVHSRDASRGSTPGGSRTQSPGYSRPWANGSSSRQASPARPSSAPPKQRFDPTEYVRQKKEREQQVAAQQRSRNPSPARSRNPSGYTTPTTGQPATRRSTSSRDAPSSSRPGSVERTRPAAAERSRPPVRAVERVQSMPGRSAGQLVRTPSGRDAINSPGRALQNVRQKLTEYVQKQQAPATAPPSVAEAPAAVAPTLPAVTPEVTQPPAGSVFEDASTEIADIDSRLHALQNFLKMAKAGSS